VTNDGARVLVVEDEPVLRGAICEALLDAGLTVTSNADGAEFAAQVAAFRPDVAVLDVMLPTTSGLALAGHLRRHTQAGIVFVTARDGVADRLSGFEVGADDYVVKPFVAAELVARVRAVLRRTGRLRSSTVEVADVVIDEDAGEVLRGGCRIAVTVTELRLLGYLARQRGRVVSKTQILTQVWGYDAYDPNLVEAYVSTLRRKLEQHGPRVIHTVRGVGYRIGDTTAGRATG
jgi:two-component system OmpR family response regulator